MLIGYARVSTEEQTLAAQLDALQAAGCGQVFQDEGVSGAGRKRPGCDQALAALGPGDVLVVWRLDRLGRSLFHLLELLQGLGERGIGFRSLTEAIDTTTAQGRLVFHLVAAFAEYERALISERTRAGMAASRRRGQKMGRRRKLTPSQVAHARELIEGGDSVAAVARLLSVGRRTLYDALKGGGAA